MSPRSPLLVALLVCLPALLAGPFAIPAQADQILLERMLWRINYHREKHGLEPVRKNDRLMAAAQAHAEAMLSDACFAHTCPEGPNLAERLRRVGYRYRVATENIAAGFERPEEVVDRWMRSDSHRVNMLDPEVAEAGLGYAYVERSSDRLEYGHYWTLDLGARFAQEGRIGSKAVPDE